MNAQRTTVRQALQMVVGVLCMFAVSAFGQYRDWVGEEEKANSRFIPQPKYLIFDSDAALESFDTGVGPKQEVKRYYLSPRIAVGWDNYIYHPYLLTYSALFEPGYSWRHSTVNSSVEDNNELALNGRINLEFLSQKPYASTFSFDRGHDEVQYGFFNLASVDSQNWGIASGYRQGGIPVQLSFRDTREDAEELFQRTISDERELDLTAHNERRNHNLTYFTYQFNQYDRTIDTGTRNITSDSMSQRVDIQDTEHFERSILRSTVRYTSRDSNQSTPVGDFATGVNYDLDLSEVLHNYYQGTYAQYDGDGFASRDLYADAGLRHQLYESLTSTLDLHGNWNQTGSGSTSDATSAGVSITEDYTKQLGNWGRVSLSDGVGFDQNHQSTSDGVLLIANESHVVPTNSIVRLNHTRALTFVSITDSNNIVLDASDFTVIHTEPWQIQINPFGPSHINPGSIVVVTYTVANDPSISSTSFANAVTLRLSFLNELASIYARYSFTDNNASQNVIIENEDVFEAGANFNWGGLVLNADYLNQHSTFFTLEDFNLSETYSRDMGYNSSLGINLNQQWDINTSKGGPADLQLRQHYAFYNFVVSYDWRPLQRLSWKNEVGYQYSTGFNVNQNLLIARSYLNWMVGKIQINTGYEHESVDYINQSKLRDYVFFKFRRNF